MNMRIKRKRSDNTILWLISTMLVLFVLAGGMYYINSKINPSANADDQMTISKEVEVRTGPDDSYPVLKKVPAGDVIEVLSKTDSWYEIETSDNYVGWVPGWSILGSGQKNPEDQNKEKLSSYAVVLNPVMKQNETPDYKGAYPKTYNLRIAKELKQKLEADGIKVFLTRDNDENIPSQDSIKKLVADNKAEMLVDLDVVNTDTKGTFGAKVYYSTTESAIIAKSIEKHLSNNYISKVSASEKQGNFSQLSDKLPQVRVVSGNIHDKVDVDILNDSVAQKQYISALKEGIEGYLYYQINIDNYNAKRKEQLLNLPQKGLTIPMYYMKQDAYKNISYGTDGKKTIEENGDAIVSLAMISNYLGLEGASVEDISSWAGSKYYIKNQGTQPTIVPAFAKKYNVKADEIDTDNTVQNIEKALKENKPVLIRLKSGLFGDKVTYKVIRGYEDEKFYINDPNDDDVKLTSYNGFTENDVKNNIAQAWAISK